jgi:hypothetical protein
MRLRWTTGPSGGGAALEHVAERGTDDRARYRRNEAEVSQESAAPECAGRHGPLDLASVLGGWCARGRCSVHPLVVAVTTAMFLGRGCNIDPR